MGWFELWFCALLITFGLYYSTGQKNGYAQIEEDIYLPQYYCKAPKIFYLLHKQKYLRFSVFWEHIIIGSSFLLYSLIILIANITAFLLHITYSDITHNILVSLIFMIPVANMVYDGLLWLYIIYRKNKDNLDKYTYK